jgi:multidrug efflux system membrane fusion protein
VPVPAVQRGEPGTFVYVINANNTVSVRPVKLGPTDGGYAAVLSGLQPGDRVGPDGTDRLRDGAAVTVPTKDAGGAGHVTPPGQAQPEPRQRPTGQHGQRRSTPAQ